MATPEGASNTAPALVCRYPHCTKFLHGYGLFRHVVDGILLVGRQHAVGHGAGALGFGQVLPAAHDAPSLSARFVALSSAASVAISPRRTRFVTRWRMARNEKMNCLRTSSGSSLVQISPQPTLSTVSRITGELNTGCGGSTNSPLRKIRCGWKPTRRTSRSTSNHATS